MLARYRLQFLVIIFLATAISPALTLADFELTHWAFRRDLLPPAGTAREAFVKLPFDSENFYEVMLIHVNKAPPDIAEVNPELSEEVATLCMKLLSKDPKRRYPSGEALAQEFEKILAKRRGSASLKQRHVGETAKPARPRDSFRFET